MELSLEHVADSDVLNRFRVAFHSAHERLLLPYPSVTGLKFTDKMSRVVGTWKTRLLGSNPLDDFVLNPGDRISFDLVANINESNSQQWGIDLPEGTYDVYYVYHVDRDTEWYDFLAKRSRFVSLTPIWRGTIQSNTICFVLRHRGNAK